MTTDQVIGIIDRSFQRRSADYKPNMWNYDHLQSLHCEFHEEEYNLQVQKAREEVKMLFVKTVEPVAKLELLDNIAKLGLNTYFQKEISGVIDDFQSLIKDKNNNLSIRSDDLYATSLSQGFLKGFLDNLEKNSNFNVKAMVNLFEASYLALEGEEIPGKARVLASIFLKNNCERLDRELGKEIHDALSLPLNLRVDWFTIKNHIHSYAKVRGCLFFRRENP